MGSSDSALGAARRAYEWGRIRSAMPWPMVLAPAFIISALYANRPWLTVTGLVGLSALAIWARWRGGGLGRAVPVAAVAGLVPLVLPLLVRGSGSCCHGGNCYEWCLAACMAGGAVSGLAVGVVAKRENPPMPFLAVATAMTAAMGLLGCVVVGVAGVGAMALTVLGTSVGTHLLPLPAGSRAE